jgi:hypothetical protein
VDEVTGEQIILQPVTLFRSNITLFFSKFDLEEWTGMMPPNLMEIDTLRRKGAPGRNNFVAWFMEKVISNLPILPGLI